MAKPGKALRRSSRAVEQLSKKTAKRIEEVQTAIDGNAFDANVFARQITLQGLDVFQAWLDMLRLVRDAPPAVFIDITVSGGGGNASKATTVTLDDTVAALNLLQKTDLTNPTHTIPAAGVALTNAVAGAAEVDDLKITVTVPNGQDVGLYKGIIHVGQAVQVELTVNVHQ
jgi:hypothetical protein